MAIAKTKTYLIIGPDGDWASPTPIKAADAFEAVIDFENTSEGLIPNVVGNIYDVYEVVGGPIRLKAVVGIAKRDE